MIIVIEAVGALEVHEETIQPGTRDAPDRNLRRHGYPQPSHGRKIERQQVHG